MGCRSDVPCTPSRFALRPALICIARENHRHIFISHTLTPDRSTRKCAKLSLRDVISRSAIVHRYQSRNMRTINYGMITMIMGVPTVWLIFAHPFLVHIFNFTTTVGRGLNGRAIHIAHTARSKILYFCSSFAFPCADPLSTAWLKKRCLLGTLHIYLVNPAQTILLETLNPCQKVKGNTEISPR